MTLAFRTNTPPQRQTLDLLSRLKLAWSLIRNSRWKPTIRFVNGVELDFANNRVILNKPTEILAKESFRITSRKHLILTSGRHQVADREDGYRYGIWENTDLDHNGDPILYEVNLKLFEPVAHGDHIVFGSRK